MHTVIKFGGSVLIDERLQRELIAQAAGLWRNQQRLLIVHGGGKQIASLLSRLGIISRFHDGLRVTDRETRDAVQMVLAGKVGKDLVAEFARAGVSAASLTGGDGSSFLAAPAPAEDGTDLGFVGRIIETDPKLIAALHGSEILPVIACLGLGAADREYYNVNGDQMASAVAAGLRADRLVFVTDVGGVNDARGEMIGRLDRAGINELLESGVASGGMRPKLRACLEALDGGVSRIRIVGAAQPDVLYRAIDEEEGLGTLIVD
jgi:acetylglutamate kinase